MQVRSQSRSLVQLKMMWARIKSRVLTNALKYPYNSSTRAQKHSGRKKKKEVEEEKEKEKERKSRVQVSKDQKDVATAPAPATTQNDVPGRTVRSKGSQAHDKQHEEPSKTQKVMPKVSTIDDSLYDATPILPEKYKEGEQYTPNNPTEDICLGEASMNTVPLPFSALSDQHPSVITHQSIGPGLRIETGELIDKNGVFRQLHAGVSPTARPDMGTRVQVVLREIHGPGSEPSSYEVVSVEQEQTGNPDQSGFLFLDLSPFGVNFRTDRAEIIFDKGKPDARFLIDGHAAELPPESKGETQHHPLLPEAEDNDHKATCRLRPRVDFYGTSTAKGESHRLGKSYRLWRRPLHSRRAVRNQIGEISSISRRLTHLRRVRVVMKHRRDTKRLRHSCRASRQLHRYKSCSQRYRSGRDRKALTLTEQEDWAILSFSWWSACMDDFWVP